MHGKAKHIWDNWWREEKPPYTPTLTPQEVRLVKNFITNIKPVKHMKEFNIKISENADSSEVVDSVADVFQIGLTIENTLEDGFQLTDILAAVQLEPTVREVANDFPVFLAQFRQLNGSSAIAAVEEAKARTVAQFGDLGKIGNFIYDFLQETAYTYQFIEGSIVQGSERLNAWKQLFLNLDTKAA